MRQPGLAPGCSPVRLARRPTPAPRPSLAQQFATRAAPRACRRPGFRTPSRSSGPPDAAWPPARACCPEPASESRRSSAPPDRAPGRPAPPGCPAAPGEGTPVSPSGRPDERTPLSPAGGTRGRARARYASRRASDRVFLQRPVIAVGDRVASLNLVGLETLTPCIEFVDGDCLDHVTLPGQERIDVLQRLTDTSAQPLDRLVIAGVAVHRRLSRAHERRVLFMQHPHVFVQVVQILVRLRQPLRVLRVQAPREYALEVLHPHLLRGVLRAAGMLQCCLDL